MESTISIEQFREELQSWKQELSSIKEEILQFENKLADLTRSHLSKDRLAQIEHFQNGFIRQKEVIDELRHDLPDSKSKQESIFRNRSWMHEEENWESSSQDLDGRMDTFRKIYIEFKRDFQRFQRDWM